MDSTYTEVAIRNLAHLMIHSCNISHLVRVYQKSETPKEKQSIRKLFDIHEAQLKTMRAELERNARYIEEFPTLYPDMDIRYSHFMTKDSQKSFKILQKIEAIGAPLRQTLKFDIAFQERKFAYQRNYSNALKFYKKNITRSLFVFIVNGETKVANYAL